MDKVELTPLVAARLDCNNDTYIEVFQLELGEAGIERGLNNLGAVLAVYCQNDVLIGKKKKKKKETRLREFTCSTAWMSMSKRERLENCTRPESHESYLR